MYNIYFDTRCVTICNRIETISGRQLSGNACDTTLFISDDKGTDEAMDLFMKKKEITSLTIACEIEQDFFERICRRFKLIVGGGGLVEIGNDRILMIFRKGSWDLPKGKHEKGEKIEETALREVMEECGLDIGKLSIKEKLCVTRHTYELDGKHMLKNTHWFRMSYAGEESARPQTEEEIEKAIWIDKAEAGKYISGAYPSIKEVFAAAKLS